MARIISERADHTDQVVVLPASIETPGQIPASTYGIFLIALLGSIFAFFAALVIAYVIRAGRPDFWNPIVLPRILWFSTILMALSSMTFEVARQLYRQGLWQASRSFVVATAVLGAAFLASQLTGWRDLARQGAFMLHNPHGTFFYLFTGLHAAHLAGGLFALAYLLYSGNKRRELVNAVCYYWHFLGVLWVALFQVLRIVS